MCLTKASYMYPKQLIETHERLVFLTNVKTNLQKMRV